MAPLKTSLSKSRSFWKKGKADSDDIPYCNVASEQTVVAAGMDILPEIRRRKSPLVFAESHVEEEKIDALVAGGVVGIADT